MKILFIYDECKRWYARPFIDAAQAMSCRNVHVRHFPAASSAVAMSICREATPYDVLVVHHTLCSNALLERRGPPVVLLERIDGAQLASRQWISRVDGVLKSYVYRDRSLYNEQTGRRFANTLAGACGGPCPNTRASGPGVPLSDTDLQKIELTYGFASFASMNQCRQQMIDWNSERDYTLQFRGHLDYKGTEIERHRMKAARIIRELSDQGDAVGPGRTDRDSYIHEMLTSRAVLSPWGWGEACHRDYEAMLLGAVPIKPDTSYVEAWPDVFTHHLCHFCRPDLSDVWDCACRITDAWPSRREHRREAKRLVTEAGNLRTIASHLVASLRRFA